MTESVPLFREPRIWWNVHTVAQERGIMHHRDLAWMAHMFPLPMGRIWDGQSQQVTLTTLAKLASALRCSISDLFTAVEPEPPLFPAGVNERMDLEPLYEPEPADGQKA